MSVLVLGQGLLRVVGGGEGVHEHELQVLWGWRYLSDTACITRPGLFSTALLV